MIEKTNFQDSAALKEVLNSWEAPNRQTFIFIMQFLDLLTLQKANQVTQSCSIGL